MTNVAVLSLMALLARDKESEEAIKAFAKAYSSSEVSARASAVTLLSQTRTLPVLAKLGELLTADEPPVRISAASGLGGFAENKAKAVAVLQAALGPNAKEFDVVAAILMALGTLRDETALPAIHQHLRSKESKDKEYRVPKAAIHAAGLARNRDSIEALIGFAKELEKAEGLNHTPDAGKAGGKGPGAMLGGASNPQKQRAKALLPDIVKALQGITKERWPTMKEWEKWWELHQATFSVPE